MERTLRTHSPLLPKCFSRLSSDHAISWSRNCLTNHHVATHYPSSDSLREAHPQATQKRITMWSVTKAHEALTTSLSREFCHLPPLQSRDETLIITSIQTEVLCFRMFVDLIGSSQIRNLSYCLLLNLLTPTLWEWRIGLIHQANPFNPSPMKS